ncbi:unnamed protein product [Rotaria sordida]|uniref:Uncharacterized protein n=1 Tax=Rotaria sordida TaxID=392033 RepID=A0A814T8F6_9BILA|nr:unnamed protein product [Rotaria sordida]
MDNESNKFRDFTKSNILVNDDVVQSFSSATHIETFHSNSIIQNDQSIDIDTNIIKNISNNDIEIKQIESNHQVQEYTFHSDINQEKILIDQQNFFIEDLIINKKFFNINEFDLIIKNLNKKLKYLELECERTQQITIHFQNQLIAIKSIGEKLSLFCNTCRSLIILAMNIRQNTNIFTYHEFEMLILYAPDSNLITTNIDQQLSIFDENLIDNYKHRLEFSRLIMNLFKQATKFRLKIATLNDVLIKSVLSKNECFNEIEQSLHLPSNIFNKNPLYEIFLYEITTTTIKQDVYIRCIRGQLIQNDIHIICTENSKHLLSQINYNASEKYSHIFDIEFKRAITSIDQLTIALPCFAIPYKLKSTNSSPRSEQSQQQIYIRCKRIMDPLIYIPAIIETYNDVSYAVFRITQTLSPISVEAVLFYPFEILQVVHDNSCSVYTSEHSSIFRIETPKNYFIRPPRVRIIPFNNELIRCMTVLKSEDQLLASSDLIEFEWYKEIKIEGIISITIPLTQYFNLFNEIDDDLQKRRRKAQQKIFIQRKKFEQEKYDEAGGSLATTPTSSNKLASPTIMSHLPSIAAVIEQVKIDNQDHLIKPRFNINRDDNSQLISSKKSPFNWKLDGFQNENASIILLGYKNRKWKNCNNFATITRTIDKDIYIITLTTLLDRIILIRCWPESNNEGKFDKLAENLWSLTSAKLFSCVLARDPSYVNSFGHYALMIVPVQAQRLAEETLYKRNYTEYIFDEQFISDNNIKTQLSKINQYQSHHTLSIRSSLPSITKYVQFCLSEGTYVRIIPMGNIDVHEKVNLSFRLHARYPVVIEFDIYPIDIYRQKTDDDFIGTLNIYEINAHSITIGSTSSTHTATAVSSRTSSGSKDFEIFDGLPNNSSPRMSVSGPETISNTGGGGGGVGRSGFERLTTHNLDERNIVCAIRIRLPKAAFQLPPTQSNMIPGIMEALTEDKRELAEALNIHPSLMNPLVISLTSQKQQRHMYSQSNTFLYENSKMNLLRDHNTKLEQTKLENETLLKWLKRQNAFKINQTIDNIISALIHIGRVDLAYMFKIDNLRYKCQSL